MEEPGPRFVWHADGAFERSQLTLMLYLDGDFEGGETEFRIFPPISVKPETGVALCFAHRVLHQGATVSRGVVRPCRPPRGERRAGAVRRGRGPPPPAVVRCPPRDGRA